MLLILLRDCRRMELVWHGEMAQSWCWPLYYWFSTIIENDLVKRSVQIDDCYYSRDLAYFNMSCLCFYLDKLQYFVEPFSIGDDLVLFKLVRVQHRRAWKTQERIAKAGHAKGSVCTQSQEPINWPKLAATNFFVEETRLDDT